ncbi:uncharacterized protein TrAtP1_009811 [Trichoderma atroviride]|uniref:uncharacterized protein n=1 Tax=Hypocrea atroviridis TaxID=63577 RepID=UPI003321DFA3|nr:hypothetical protein TrAtP1_009811 [Trichoderma atroviride]
MVTSASAPVRGERSQPHQELPSTAVVEMDAGQGRCLHRGIQMLQQLAQSAAASSQCLSGAEDEELAGMMPSEEPWPHRSPPGLTRMLVSRLARAAAFATVLVVAW